MLDAMSEEAISESDLEESLNSEDERFNEDEKEEDNEDQEDDEDENDGDDEDDGVGECHKFFFFFFRGLFTCSVLHKLSLK